MPTTLSLSRKLGHLARATGRRECEILAQAVEVGMDSLYRKQIAESYLAGRIGRRRAVSDLGSDLVEELDYAREAVIADVKWGLKNA